MEKIINVPAFVKHFKAGEAFCLPNVGYNDFHTLRAAHCYHIERNYTWHFILSGRGALEIGGKRYELGQGDMFFTPPDTEMCYYPLLEDPWEYVWFTLKGATASYYGELLGFSLQNAAQKCRRFQMVRLLLQDMLQALLRGECGHFGALSFFYRIMECCTGERTEEIQSIKEMIDGSFTLSTFSIEGVCKDAGISHVHLLRQFKKAYGVTIIEYVVQKRIELACELLATTVLPVHAVAFSCGFADEIHFMKTFKRKTGLCATAYRKLYHA